MGEVNTKRLSKIFGMGVLFLLLLSIISPHIVQAELYGIVKVIKNQVLSDKGEMFEVTVSSKDIPEGATLQVTDIKEAKEYLEASQGLVEGEIVTSYFMDIAILKDGVEIEPDGPVDVEIKALDSTPEGVAANIVHFVPSAAEPFEEPEMVEDVTFEGEDIAFSTDSFSVYGVVYTVDFHWDIHGKEYSYSIPGGGYITLSQLIEVLNIQPEQIETITSGVKNTKKLLEEVESVKFSSPELVWVGKLDEEKSISQIIEDEGLEVQYSVGLTEINDNYIAAGEWVFISLLPFDTEEEITITMTNGDTWTIRVTDASMNINSNVVKNGLDGKAFVLTVGRSMLTSEHQDSDRLKAQTIIPANLPTGGTVWKFVNAGEDNKYFISNNNQYLHVNQYGVTTSSTPQAITVKAGSDPYEGKIRLTDGDRYAVNLYNGRVDDGFGRYDDKNSDGNEQFTLYPVPAESSRALKISLSDLVAKSDTDNPVEDVIIYTRILNDTNDGYDYYAVGADGSLARVYNLEDEVGWTSAVGSNNYLRWKFTVHKSEGNPNGYFDFQSMESNQYLIPTDNGILKADDPSDNRDLGVNLPGWGDGTEPTYETGIDRWSADTHQYVGYAYDSVNKKIVPTTDETKKLDFMFAVPGNKIETDNGLHTVETLDGSTKGITVKMYDFSSDFQLNQDGNYHWPRRSAQMSNVIGTTPKCFHSFSYEKKFHKHLKNPPNLFF